MPIGHLKKKQEHITNWIESLLSLIQQEEQSLGTLKMAKKCKVGSIIRKAPSFVKRKFLNHSNIQRYDGEMDR